MVVGIDSNKAAKVASDLLGKAANEFVTSTTGSISGSVDSLNSTLATVKDLAKGVVTEPSAIESFFKPLQDLLKFGGDLIKSGSSFALSSILSIFGLAPPAPEALPAPAPS
ncbi:MAG: hypothetical protein K2X09_03165, partial [Rickettsiales bacterium]|nr:hypothetical protein [Rickettsiales bacterium]